MRFPRMSLQRTTEEHNLLQDRRDESVESVDNANWITFKAGLLLLLGAGIAVLFADPLVDAVDNFSDATGIPSFFISFIAMPLATNSSEAVSAIIFASRKKQRTSSLTFSEVCLLHAFYAWFLICIICAAMPGRNLQAWKLFPSLIEFHRFMLDFSMHVHKLQPKTL